jgi:hypothetical protein
MGFALRSNRLLGHMSHMELFGWLFGWHAYCYKCPASPLMLCVPAWLCPFRYNKGYALLLYDNSDISAYMKQFYPGFMPSEQDQHMHGGWWSYSATEPILLASRQQLAGVVAVVGRGVGFDLHGAYITLCCLP